VHNDQHTNPFFNFIHPDHTCLPAAIKALWNIAAVLMFFAPFAMACTSCLGIVLGLSGLQAACPLLTQGIALTVTSMVKGNVVALTGLLLTVGFCERHELAQFIRDDLYRTIEKEVMPRFHQTPRGPL
jgi:hypothetical protein